MLVNYLLTAFRLLDCYLKSFPLNLQKKAWLCRELWLLWAPLEMLTSRFNLPDAHVHHHGPLSDVAFHECHQVTTTPSWHVSSLAYSHLGPTWNIAYEHSNHHLKNLKRKKSLLFSEFWVFWSVYFGKTLQPELGLKTSFQPGEWGEYSSHSLFWKNLILS